LKNPYHRQTEANPYRDYRRVPMTRLINRLGLAKYDLPAPLTDPDCEYGRVKLMLRQHAGVPAVPVVSVGQPVAMGDLVAEIPGGALGAPVHASLSGVVCEINSDSIVIEAR